MITAVNNEIDESSHSLKDSKFLTLLNSALISFIDLNLILNSALTSFTNSNSILNQLLTSESISKLSNIFNLSEQIRDHLSDICKEFIFITSLNSYITIEFNT